MLNQSDIKEIKKLYSDMFGVKLDNDTARLKLSLLVRQVELTYKPPTIKEELYGKVTSSKSKQKSTEK